jgi:DNA polymerase-1
MQTKIKPILSLFIANREATKILDTYTASLLEHKIGNRIHAGFLQVNTAAGRMASRKPSLQNLPRSNDEGDDPLLDIRSAFIADDDYVLVIVDYVQVEFKIASAFSQDDFLVRAANDKKIDVHSNTAQACFGADPKTTSKTEFLQIRQAAKTLTYAILYGASGFAISKQLPGISPARGDQLIADFYQAYPGLLNWLEKAHAFIMANGYSETYYKRRRWASQKDLVGGDDRTKERELRRLVNAIIQGSSADITKIAMKLAYNAYRKHNLDATIVAQIHDELVVLCRADQAQEVKQITEACMVHKIFDVNLPVDGRIAYSLSKLEKKTENTDGGSNAPSRQPTESPSQPTPTP